MLPLEIGLGETVQQWGRSEHEVHDHRVGLRIRTGEQRSLERLLTSDRRTLGEERRDVRMQVDGRSALQDLSAITKNTVEESELLPPRVRRRQRARTVFVAVDLVEGIGHRRQTQHPRIDGVLEHRAHPAEFRASRLDLLVGAAPQSEYVRADVGMTDEGRDIGSEGKGFEGGGVRRGTGPGLVRFEDAQHRVVGNCFDPAEQIRDLARRRIHRRQRAIAEHDRRDAVANRFRKPWTDQGFGVVVRVDVDKAGENPFAGRVDHFCVRPDLEARRGHLRDHAVSNSEITTQTWSPRPVEPQPVVDHDVESRHCRTPRLTYVLPHVIDSVE